MPPFPFFFFSGHPLIPPSFPYGPCPTPHSFSSAFDCIKGISSLQHYSFALSGVEESVEIFSLYPSFHYVERRPLQRWSLSPRVSKLFSPLCAGVCLYLSPEWVPPLHQVCDYGKLCVLEKCMYWGENSFWGLFHLSWLWFLVLIWFVFIWFIWFRNCLLFSISYCSQLCWIIWVPYLWNS